MTEGVELPPEIAAALDVVNARLCAALGVEDVSRIARAILSEQSTEDVCRRLLAAESTEPVLVDGLMAVTDAYAEELHEHGHALPCDKHINTIRIGLVMIFMLGRVMK